MTAILASLSSSLPMPGELAGVILLSLFAPRDYPC